MSVPTHGPALPMWLTGPHSFYVRASRVGVLFVFLALVTFIHAPACQCSAPTKELSPLLTSMDQRTPGCRRHSGSCWFRSLFSQDS